MAIARTTGGASVEAPRAHPRGALFAVVLDLLAAYVHLGGRAYPRRPGPFREAVDLVALACARRQPGLSDDLACLGWLALAPRVPRNLRARTEGAARTFTSSFFTNRPRS
ncbi:MAG: hypothetical protein ACRDZX_09855 [Acidimicrobiales bacterium]